MAALLPLIKDLAPLVLPTAIHIKRAAELQPQPPPSTGKISTIPAITELSKKLCASVLTLPPLTKTSIRHHGEADTILNILSNNCTLLTCPHSDGIVAREVLGAGDFVLIPAWTEYQLLNESLPMGESQPVDPRPLIQMHLPDGGGAFNQEISQDLQQPTSTDLGIVMEDHDPIQPSTQSAIQPSIQPAEKNAWANENLTPNPSIVPQNQTQTQAPIPALQIQLNCVLTLTSSQGFVDEIVELKGWGMGVKR